MIECAVRVPSDEWGQWLAFVADTRRLRAVEVPSELLAPNHPPVLDLCGHLDLDVFHVADALPPNLGRYFIESGFLDVDHAIQALRQGLLARLKGGVRFASFDLGLDRIDVDPETDGLTRRVELVSHLLEETDDLEVTLGVRVRLPRPFPSSHEWEWAGNIIHEMDSGRCALGVDVVMDDLLEIDDAETFVRSCASQLALVRFLYDPKPGERPMDDAFADWAKALRYHAMDVGVVFCPRAVEVLWAETLLRDIERWVSFFEDE